MCTITLFDHGIHSHTYCVYTTPRVVDRLGEAKCYSISFCKSCFNRMRADECLNSLERFGFCVAPSIGFKFGDITANATAGAPFTLTWYLDQGDNPGKLYLKQRLTSQNSGDGRNIPFSPPSNGTRSGIVTFTFEVPGCVCNISTEPRISCSDLSLS